MGTSLQLLPLELRLKIYRELLVAEQAVTAPGVRPKPKSSNRLTLTLTFVRKQPKQLHPAILRACKQIYAEASFILLKENHFYYNDVKQVMDFRSDQYVMQAFARIKHLHLAFELIEKTPSILQCIIDHGCSLETLCISFEFDLTSRPSNYEQLTLAFMLEAKYRDKEGPGGDLAEDKFYDLVAELDVHEKIEVSVQSTKEHWCELVEDFAAIIGTEREWSSVLTNGEFLPKQGKHQHGKPVSEISSHANDVKSGEQKGIWKRTWTLKPVDLDQSVDPEQSVDPAQSVDPDQAVNSDKRVDTDKLVDPDQH